MELEKIRNFGDGDLVTEEKKAAEQLFRLRFQIKLGQSEGVKKLRALKKDIARIKTIARERELGLYGEKPQAESTAPVKAAKTKKPSLKTEGAKTKGAKIKSAKIKKEAR